MNIVQQAAIEALFNELMDRDELDLVKEFDEIKGAFINLKVTKGEADGIMTCLMLGRAREKLTRQQHEAESAKCAVNLVRQTYDSILGNAKSLVKVDVSNHNDLRLGCRTMINDNEFNTNSGNAANLGGRSNKAEIGSQVQAGNQIASTINWAQMTEELSLLRSTMAAVASEDPEHIVGLASVRAAEKSAEKGEGAKALDYLKKGGKYVYDFAMENVAAPLLIEYLKGNLPSA